MDWSLVVSIVALVLSAGTVAWQVVRVVVVSGIQGSHRSAGEELRWQYRIDVSGVGGHHHSGGPHLSEGRGGELVHDGGPLQEEVETFPIRLEPHDSRS